MNLDNTKSLQVVLDAAVAANELQCVVGYEHLDTRGVRSDSSATAVTSGATAKEIVAAPTGGDRIAIKSVGVYNADTAAAAVSVQMLESSTAYTLIKATLAAGETLTWDERNGWRATTTTGAAKTGLPVTASTLSDGKIPIGSSTNIAAEKTLSGDATMTREGVITVVDVTVGSDAAGDLPYKSSATALARLAIGAAGAVLQVNAGATAPQWAAISGDVAVADGGAMTIQPDAVEDSMILSEIVKDLGSQAVGHVDITGDVIDGESVTINSRVYELDTHDAETITGDVRVDVSGGSTVKSQGTLTLAENAANTNTVTIGAKVYTFQDVLTDVDGNVAVGADASGSIDNLIAAIMLGAGSGTAYAASTTLHPTVTAAAGAADTMVVTAKEGGTAGDAIATTDTLAGASAFDDVTLGTTTAGVDPIATEAATALVAAVNADVSRVVDAIDVGDGTVLFVAKAAGASNYALAKSGTNIVVSAAACVGAAVAAVKSVHKLRRAITAADATVTTDTDGTIAIGGIPATSAPTVFIAQCRDSAGAPKAISTVEFVWAQANTNFYVLKAVENQNGATALADGDVIDVIVIE